MDWLRQGIFQLEQILPSALQLPGLLLYSLLAFLLITYYRSKLLDFIEREVDFDAGINRVYKERQIERNVEAERLLQRFK